MKFYIAVDCEGPACVVGEPGKGLGSGENYRFACLQATREANAAARALFDAGAQEVVVWDAHGTGVNLQYDLLDPRCRILLGSGHRGRFAGMDKSYTAVLFIGYHARENTSRAVLAHTFCSTAFQYYKLDGKEAGVPSTRHTRASWAFRCCSARATTPVWPRPVRCFPASPPL